MTYGVYVYRDHEGRPLYVGQTNDMARRDYQHRLESRWRAEAVVVDVLSTHETRRGALDAERKAIAEHAPLYNMRHNGLPIPRVSPRDAGWVLFRAALGGSEKRGAA